MSDQDEELTSPFQSIPMNFVRDDSPVLTEASEYAGCNFDPVTKDNKLLCMRFDTEGNSTMTEMTRQDLLQETQEAAKNIIKAHPTPNPDGAAGGGKSKAVPYRRMQTIDPSRETILDIQRVHARDIRKLDSTFSLSNEPAVIIRQQAILFSADPLRAIIMRDCCIVLVPDGADTLLSTLREQFREATDSERTEDEFYEFKAMEAILATLSSHFESDYTRKSPYISETLDRLAQGRVSARKLEQLRIFKTTMREFESHIDGVKRALMTLLDNEEDLRLLYLTKLNDDPKLLYNLWSFDSEDAEILIENYLQDIVSTRTKAALLQHRIDTTESLVTMKLDSMRNYLLGVDIIFSLVAISLSIGTFVTGAFGMNLKSGLEDADGWFIGVIIASLAIFVVFMIFGVLFFKRKGVFL